MQAEMRVGFRVKYLLFESYFNPNCSESSYFIKIPFGSSIIVLCLQRDWRMSGYQLCVCVGVMDFHFCNSEHTWHDYRGLFEACLSTDRELNLLSVMHLACMCCWCNVNHSAAYSELWVGLMHLRILLQYLMLYICIHICNRVFNANPPIIGRITTHLRHLMMVPCGRNLPKFT
jgi:hypothetical protein